MKTFTMQEAQNAISLANSLEQIAEEIRARAREGKRTNTIEPQLEELKSIVRQVAALLVR